MLLNTSTTSDTLERWSKRIRVDIFKMKLLFFPFHRNHHWSLMVVVNPGSIRECTRPSYKGSKTCILFFDSLGSNTSHDKKMFGTKILGWLNSQWKVRPGRRTDDTVVPFHARLVKTYTPSGRHNLYYAMFIFYHLVTQTASLTYISSEAT